MNQPLEIELHQTGTYILLTEKVLPKSIKVKRQLKCIICITSQSITTINLSFVLKENYNTIIGTINKQCRLLFQSMWMEILKCIVGCTYSHTYVHSSKYIWGMYCSIIPCNYISPDISPGSFHCRCVLCQPGRWQGPDEDGPGAGAGGPCQLPAGGASARRRAQARQPACPGSHHGVRHLQRHSPRLRPHGKGCVLFSDHSLKPFP